ELVVFSQTTIFLNMPKRRSLSFICSSSVGKFSGCSDGSSINDAHITALAAARGRLAHQRCKVDGCPYLIDFSREASLFIASKGSAISISFLAIYFATSTLFKYSSNFSFTRQGLCGTYSIP